MLNLDINCPPVRKLHHDLKNVYESRNVSSISLRNQLKKTRSLQNIRFTTNSNITIKANRITLLCIYIFLSISLPISIAQDMCCLSTSYGAYDSWSMCYNAADESLGVPTTCDTCVSYQCIDWFVGLLIEFCSSLSQ